MRYTTYFTTSEAYLILRTSSEKQGKKSMGKMQNLLSISFYAQCMVGKFNKNRNSRAVKFLKYIQYSNLA